MTGRRRAGTIPAEIVAAQRRKRWGAVRLYALSALLLLGLALGGLAIENHIQQGALQENLHLSRAGADLEQGNLPAAEREVEAILAVDPTNYRATYDLALLFLKNGQYTEALARLQHAATLSNTSDTHFFAAVAALALHRPSLALHEAQLANTLQPDDYATMALLAMADRALGHAALAAREHAAALSLGYQGQTLRAMIDAVPLE